MKKRTTKRTPKAITEVPIPAGRPTVLVSDENKAELIKLGQAALGSRATVAAVIGLLIERVLLEPETVIRLLSNEEALRRAAGGRR